VPTALGDEEAVVLALAEREAEGEAVGLPLA
jgi:hypothetical protein